MGIRFLCDHCSSRIHVKDFLAGRRAKCPQCNNKMTIPMESTISREEVVAKSAIVSTDNADDQEAKATQPDKSKAPGEKVASSDSTVKKPAAKARQVDKEKLAKANKARPKETETKPVAKSSRTVPASEKKTTVAKPTAKPASKETDANSGPISETFQDVVPAKKSDKSVGRQTDDAHEDSAGNDSAGNDSPGNDGTGNDGTGKSSANAETVQSVDDADRPADKPDLIEEDPNALWYVAPPSGGKYGPADAKMMRGWIEEGRVSADSLVWREGWDDWRSATAIMSDGEQSATVAPATVAPATVAPSTHVQSATGSDSTAIPAEQTRDATKEKNQTESDTRVPSSMRYHRARSQSRMMGVLLIIALALVSIGLLVWLIIAVSTGP